MAEICTFIVPTLCHLLLGNNSDNRSGSSRTMITQEGTQQS